MPSSGRARIAAGIAAGLVGVVALVIALSPGERETFDPGNRWSLDTPSAPSVAEAPPPPCTYPSQLLDLSAWKVTMPTGEQKKPTEVTQPSLARFDDKPWFQLTPGCDGVAFRAPVNGVTTSGSGYPRSELREMQADGSPASWSSGEGTHTFVVDEAFTALPQGRPNLVGAQIHDEDDDISVFRLEGSRLYVTKGKNAHFKLVTARYALGTRFEAKYVVSGGTVQAFYNGAPQVSFAADFSDAYFKAGAYTQANCKDDDVPCSSSNYGETTIYGLRTEHS